MVDVSPATGSIEYIEPGGQDSDPSSASVGSDRKGPSPEEGKTNQVEGDTINRRIIGKVLRLGDFIDTDAVSPPFLTSKYGTPAASFLTHAPQIIPSDFMMGSASDEELGSHCMQYFMPEFREMVKGGLNVVVGGNAFGCGSSREVAVNALIGKSRLSSSHLHALSVSSLPLTP